MKKALSLIMAVVMLLCVFAVSTGAKTTYNAKYAFSASVNGKTYGTGDTITVAPGDTVTVALNFSNNFYLGSVAAQIFYNSNIFSGATAEFNKSGRVYNASGTMMCTFADWDKIAATNKENWWPNYSAAKLSEFKQNHKFCYTTMTPNPTFGEDAIKDINETIVTYTFRVSKDAKNGATGQILMPVESEYRTNYKNGRTMCSAYASEDMNKGTIKVYDEIVYDLSKAVLNFKVSASSVTKGDVNGDGKINSADALLVLQSSVGKITLSAGQKNAADTNGDGKINSADALMILQCSVGKIKL